MDAQAAAVFLKKLEDEVWDDEHGYSKYMMKEMEKTYVDTRSWANFTLEESKGNLITFTSGLGDGVYPSYFGFDSHGTLVSLVTDFGFVDLS